jgi:hypothetical protein
LSHLEVADLSTYTSYLLFSSITIAIPQGSIFFSFNSHHIVLKGKKSPGYETGLDVTNTVQRKYLSLSQNNLNLTLNRKLKFFKPLHRFMGYSNLA